MWLRRFDKGRTPDGRTSSVKLCSLSSQCTRCTRGIYQHETLRTKTTNITHQGQFHRPQPQLLYLVLIKRHLQPFGVFQEKAEQRYPLDEGNGKERGHKGPLRYLFPSAVVRLEAPLGRWIKIIGFVMLCFVPTD